MTIFKNFFLFFCFLIVISCASSKKITNPQTSNDSDFYGPPIQEQKVQTEGVPPSQPVLPQPAPVQPPTTVAPPANAPNICLVLGPGMAKGFAHAGVIKALVNANITIDCIIGVEAGALVGSMFALDANINTVLWQLFKIRKDQYLDFPFFSLSEKLAQGKKLHSLLSDYFQNRHITDLKIKFYAIAADPNTRSTIILKTEPVADAVSASLALPDIFEPWHTEDGAALVSGALSSPLPVQLAKDLGARAIIVVNVLDNKFGSTANDKDEERVANQFVNIRNLSKLQKIDQAFVVDVNTEQFPFTEFAQQSSLIEAGNSSLSSLVGKLKEYLQTQQVTTGAK